MKSAPANARTLREIDTDHGWEKGTAFRRFKQLAKQAREEQDYWVYAPPQPEFSRLQPRLYPGSQRAILLSQSLAVRLPAADERR